jgi:site-specific DNA recombinase
MKIAAIYARVSSARQQHQDTIASQVAALLDYAQTHDYHLSPQRIYQDEGYSGASLDRPALDRLRDAVATGEVKVVLILSPDRLARQFAYQYLVTEEFERAGCQVIFLSHGLAATPAERMLQEMTGVFAEYARPDHGALSARAVVSGAARWGTHDRGPLRLHLHSQNRLVFQQPRDQRS